VRKSALKDERNRYEDELLVRFKEVLPEGFKVTLLAELAELADRGLGDQKLSERLRGTFDFIIRIRGNITVTSACGESYTSLSCPEGAHGSEASATTPA